MIERARDLILDKEFEVKYPEKQTFVHNGTEYILGINENGRHKSAAIRPVGKRYPYSEFLFSDDDDPKQIGIDRMEETLDVPGDNEEILDEEELTSGESPNISGPQTPQSPQSPGQPIQEVDIQIPKTRANQRIELLQDLYEDIEDEEPSLVLDHIEEEIEYVKRNKVDEGFE